MAITQDFNATSILSVEHFSHLSRRLMRSSYYILAALVSTKVVVASRTMAEKLKVTGAIDITVAEDEMAVGVVEAEDEVVVGTAETEDEVVVVAEAADIAAAEDEVVVGMWEPSKYSLEWSAWKCNSWTLILATCIVTLIVAYTITSI
ncbi:hypothetical protein ARMGADRAFT_1034978 [Armillaria gallica]|uniref:Transmembrane protein n=1 Tax=Armillaria gallica TaxID=47427 RepID=A0A2H3CZ25_ARMGA|nr:hypothetical protein ARMGADRAFT_1034978 [Armillaria gallica]